MNPPNVVRELVPDSYQQNVPGYTVMFMFFIVTVIATSVFTERNSGALRRVRATPVSRIAIVIGKTLPFFAINFLQVVIMFSIARLAFGMDLVNIPALLVITAGLSVAATGMGSLITNLVRTEAQAGSIGVLLVLVLAALSGSMFPRSLMPEAMQTIGFIAPHTWGLTAYQDVLVRGLSIPDIPAGDLDSGRLRSRLPHHQHPPLPVLISTPHFRLRRPRLRRNRQPWFLHRRSLSGHHPFLILYTHRLDPLRRVQHFPQQVDFPHARRRVHRLRVQPAQRVINLLLLAVWVVPRRGSPSPANPTHPARSS